MQKKKIPAQRNKGIEIQFKSFIRRGGAEHIENVIIDSDARREMETKKNVFPGSSNCTAKRSKEN